MFVRHYFVFATLIFGSFIQKSHTSNGVQIRERNCYFLLHKIVRYHFKTFEKKSNRRKKIIFKTIMCKKYKTIK
jgi:hypothetical protein